LLPFPDAEQFIDLCDKQLVLERAKAHAIPVPAQIVVRTRHDISSEPLPTDFPVALKPARSVAGGDGHRIRTGVTYASDAAQLDRALHDIPDEAYPVLVQQLIGGVGFGISVLVWDGTVVAAFAHRRIREKPPTGGVSVVRESIAIDESLLNKSVSLLADFDWRGVAMVEFKLDARTNTPYLMEINGRFWGSLQLAIDAGVDFPALLVRLALGDRVSPVTSYEIGVQSRWEWGEVDHLLARVLHPARTNGAAAHPRTRAAAVLAFLKEWGGSSRAEVFQRDDPAPFLRESIDWMLRR
jgi:predicted ATP-grasp superfamily ATP-dependent carboligase